LWYDNIPLLSFFLLGGKCRHCNKNISWRYPAIEIGSSLGFLLIFLKFGSSGVLNLLWLWFVFLICLLIFVIDLENQIIPDELSFLGFVATFFVFIDSERFFPSILTGFLCALFLLLVNLVTKGKGMGLGDVKLALFLGAFLGYPLSITWIFLAFLTGAFLGVILILGKKASFGRPIAFGPFLVLSFIAVLLWGDRLTNLLWSF
jgi:prepilin signal peptidase PulO-like enzyme (type II secretory pathway)